MRKKIEKIPNSKKKKKSQEQMQNTPKTHIHDRSLSWLGTGTSIKSGGVKLVLWAQNSPISKIKIIFIDGFSC